MAVAKDLVLERTRTPRKRSRTIVSFLPGQVYNIYLVVFLFNLVLDTIVGAYA
jgi:hypothetical protein